MNDNQPLALIAGIALGSYRRCRRQPSRCGWNIRVLPGLEHRRGDLRGIWKRVLHLWDNGPNAGTHLLLAHDKEDERPGFLELKHRSCRAMWLSREFSNRYGSEAFTKVTDDFLRFEEQWRCRLRPSLNSPLLLPQTAFSAHPSVQGTWKRVRGVDSLHDSIEAVENSISRFNQHHRTNGVWCDSRELAFSRCGYHGHHDLPAWRRQKFTFRFPDGFHFDVKHSRDRRFTLHNQEGSLKHFVRYTNIDPHGFLRGGG